MNILHKYLTMPSLLFVLVLFSTGLLFADDIQVSITSPVNGAKYAVCTDIEITIDLVVNSGEVEQVNFYRNGRLAAMDKRAPYVGSLKKQGNGYYEFTVGVVGSDEVEIFSDPVFIIIGEWMQGNRILNGNFDCVLAPWVIGNYEGGSGTATIEADAGISEGDAVHVEVNNPGTLYWHIQLMQDFPILAGHTYEVYFIADTPQNKEIYVAFQMDHSPFTNYLELPVEAEGNNEYGPYILEATVDDPTVEFKFMVGGNDVPIYFDDVVILDLNMDPVSDVENKAGLLPQSALVTNNYPNPFNGKTRIFYQLPEQADVVVRLFNIQGEMVRELVNASQSGGHHFIDWDGLNDAGQPLASGTYIYRIEAASTQNSYKVTHRVHLVQ